MKKYIQTMLSKLKKTDRSVQNTYYTSTVPQNNNHSSNEQIPDTPFRIVGDKDQGYILTIGKYKITEPAPTPEKAKIKLTTEHWNIITNLIILMPQLITEGQKLAAENKAS